MRQVLSVALDRTRNIHLITGRLEKRLDMLEQIIY